MRMCIQVGGARRAVGVTGVTDEWRTQDRLSELAKPSHFITENNNIDKKLSD